MSWSVQVRRLDHVKPHPNADKLELGYIGRWQFVIPKGEYNSGDLVVYFPTDSIIPDKLLEDWGLTGRLAGSQKNRVKPVRLRGESSIGIVCPAPESAEEGDNMEEWYGITRYEPPIPVELSGKMKGRPEGYLKYDLENINYQPTAFAEGDPVLVHEKIHGTHVVFGLVNGEFLVSSRSVNLIESESNTYWQVARKYRVEEMLRTLAAGEQAVATASGYGDSPIPPMFVHGEIFGPIQDLKYGSPSDLQLVVFDIRMHVGGTEENLWLSWNHIQPLCDRYEIPTPPLLYEGPYSESVLNHADGMEQVSGKETHIREGCVVRLNNGPNDRLILKVVSDAYLYRKNGTEYH